MPLMQATGSSIPVKWAFGGGHNVASLQCSSLSAETISALMMAWNWIKLEQQMLE